MSNPTKESAAAIKLAAWKKMPLKEGYTLEDARLYITGRIVSAAVREGVMTPDQAAANWTAAETVYLSGTRDMREGQSWRRYKAANEALASYDVEPSLDGAANIWRILYFGTGAEQ